MNNSHVAGRVDEPTSVRKFRAVPRASYVPLEWLPDRLRVGRSGCRGALFLLRYGFVWVFGVWPAAVITHRHPTHTRAYCA
jgi:hypothetical protein